VVFVDGRKRIRLWPHGPENWLEVSGRQLPDGWRGACVGEEGLVFAARNPLNAAHMVLVAAGNDALRTVKASRLEAQAEYVLLDDGTRPATASSVWAWGALQAH